jgi:hypothetical protein
VLSMIGDRAHLAATIADSSATVPDAEAEP